MIIGKFIKWLFGNRTKPTGQIESKVAESANVANQLRCEHGKVDHPLTVRVLGRDCELVESPMCPVCTEAYLNKNSTLCAKCLEPILPGMSVGLAWHKAPHPYTHLTMNCCISGGMYCGIWKEGRLATLHELRPDKYPQGTGSVVGHALCVKKVVIENP